MEHLLVWNTKSNQVEINAKIAFRFYSQFGFPLEMFEELFNEKFPHGSISRRNMIISAYNVANSTSYTI